MWAVKILLTLRKAAEAGVPPMKSPELLAACVAPHADTYMYRRALRELVAKTDFVTCDIQSSRTTYEWNPDVRPSLYDLVIRLGAASTRHRRLSGRTRTPTRCSLCTR